MTLDVICLICKTMHKAKYPVMLLPAHRSSPDNNCAGAGKSGLPVALIHVYIG